MEIDIKNLPEFPKHANKCIFWDKKTKTGQAFIMVGYCPNTLDWILALYNEAKKNYPKLGLGEVISGKIRKSCCYDGFTFISFHVKSKAKGWEIRKESQLDFFFNS